MKKGKSTNSQLYPSCRVQPAGYLSIGNALGLDWRGFAVIASSQPLSVSGKKYSDFPSKLPSGRFQKKERKKEGQKQSRQKKSQCRLGSSGFLVSSISALSSSETGYLRQRSLQLLLVTVQPLPQAPILQQRMVKNSAAAKPRIQLLTLLITARL